MFNSTIELFTLAASNSLLIFCFCNLIIVILLLVGSKPPTSEFDQDSPIPSPTVVFHANENHIGGANAKCSLDHNSASIAASELYAENEIADDKEETEIEEEDDDDDDELRRRVEEFIEKMNRGWKAEKLRTYLVV